MCFTFSKYLIKYWDVITGFSGLFLLTLFKGLTPPLYSINNLELN